jgi:hypothetical protein
MESLRALSIRQPWASLILSGAKRIENRSRPTHFRGRVFIHASLSQADREFFSAGFDTLPRGAIIGSVEIIDCKPLSEVANEPYAEGPWCWILADARAIDPVPCKGMLSFWQVPAEVLKRIGAVV